MIGPSRPVPRVGGAVRLTHFGGDSEPGIVLSVGEHGRRLEVRSESGEVIEFVLSRATGRFVCAGDSRGPRLELLRAP